MSVEGSSDTVPFGLRRFGGASRMSQWLSGLCEAMDMEDFKSLFCCLIYGSTQKPNLYSYDIDQFVF